MADLSFIFTSRHRVGMVACVPPADNETPDLTLCGEGTGWKLVLSEGCGRAVSEPLDQPDGVIGLLEIEQRPAQVLDGIEGVHPEQVLLQRADEPLGAAISLRRPDEGWGAFGAQEGDLVLKDGRHVLAPVIMPD